MLFPSQLRRTLHFSFVLKTQQKHLGKLRLEFAIDFMKANGKQTRKVFKIAEANYNTQTKTVQKQFSFKPITTRNTMPERTN